jgi:hypothetical protein
MGFLEYPFSLALVMVQTDRFQYSWTPAAGQAPDFVGLPFIREYDILFDQSFGGGVGTFWTIHVVSLSFC